MGGCDFWYSANRERHALELYARIASRHPAGAIYRLDFTAVTGTDKHDLYCEVFKKGQRLKYPTRES
eukprot:3289125-Rhodomonas_salina.1